ncbi:MAG: lamin tail domain-containing protein [Desulfobacterales bacterium]|nr:lamin tail domain-containing protein [Desulfobacterales bacterium]
MKHVNWILVLLMMIIAPGVMASTVFINEIHYDNDGSDISEGVELAGMAGLDLSGWSLVLYNGSNGTSYGSKALDGIFSDQKNGYGFSFFTFSSVSMQNGSPDGVALVDDTNSVVQFLSYEGSFTANDGIASGVTSTDIGVCETGTTPEGYSLQLTGTGNEYDDFIWTDPSVSTFGSINQGQVFSSVPISGSIWLFSSGLVGLLGFRRKI